jgi:homoserine kinase type II
VNVSETTLSAWGVIGPCRFSPLADGTNNQVVRVDTPGASYVLRVYRNHAEPERLRFELAVLARLASAGLPFAVPAPLPTIAGEPMASLTDDGDTALVTLTPLIPGAPPDRGDPAQATAAGAALGLLDATLARLDLAADEAAASWRSYGDLEHCHPLVHDPRAAIGALPVAEATRRELLSRYAWLMERVPALYAALPQQLSHEDYGPSNVLMDGPRVTGVLDFEFSARDVRAMDLTVALSWWPLGRFGRGTEWPVIRAFAAGYARHMALAQDEIAAIPVLFELRAYTSLIHRLGRYRAGLSPMHAVTGRATAALERRAWLDANGARLVETIADALAGSEPAH